MIRRVFAVYGRANDRIDPVVIAFSSILLGVVVLLTAIEIVGRNVFKYS